MAILVTGGAGYFDEVLCKHMVEKGLNVKSFDLYPCAVEGVESIQADIRDKGAVAAACKCIEVIYHNVAQVPLAKDKDLFWSSVAFGYWQNEQGDYLDSFRTANLTNRLQSTAQYILRQRKV